MRPTEKARLGVVISDMEDSTILSAFVRICSYAHGMRICSTVDGHCYAVTFIRYVWGQPDGPSFAVEFRVTGGLVPHREPEYVTVAMGVARAGSERAARIIVFIEQPGGTCVPCDTWQVEETKVVESLAARYVHNKRKEPTP